MLEAKTLMLLERVENSFSGDREIVHFAPKNVIGRRRKVVALRG